MMSPEEERRVLLGEAIRQATGLLKAPIDRIEVGDRHVTCSAGSQTVVLAYVFKGGWQLSVAPNPASRQPEVIGRAFAKLLKKRGW